MPQQDWFTQFERPDPSPVPASGGAPPPSSDVYLSLSSADRRGPVAPQPGPPQDDWFAQFETKPPAPTPERSLSKDLISSFGSFTEGALIEPVMGLFQIMSQFSQRPVDTTVGIVKGVGEAQGAEYYKAREALGRKDYPAAMGHALAYLVPILGPAAATIVSEAQETGDWAKATGRITAMAAPAAYGRWAKAGAARPRPSTDSPVPLTVAERSGSKVAQFAEGITEHTLPGGGVFGRFRMRQQEALAKLADDLVERISPQADTPYSAGAAVQGGLRQAQETITKQIGVLYDEIDSLTRSARVRHPTTITEPSRIVGPSGEALETSRRVLRPTLEGGVAVPTVTLKSVAVKLLRRMNENTLIPPQELARSRTLLEHVIRGPRTMTFRAFQDMRSDLLGIARSSHADPIPGRAAGITKQLIATTDQAMMRAARQSNVPGLADKVRAANTAWRNVKTQFNETVIKKLLDAPPERVTQFIQGAPLDDIAEITSTLPREVMDQVRARLVRDMLDKAMAGELAKPGTFAQYGLSSEGLPSTVATMKGKTLHGQMERLGSERLTAVFGDTTAHELLEIGKWANRVSGNRAGMARGLIAASMNATILGPVLSPIVGMSIGSWGATAGMTTAFNALARILVRQRSARTNYAAFLRALSRGDVQAAQSTGLALTFQLQRELISETQTPDEKHPN
tara:strand:- start:410 stop:2461 length:2052 start_codon:yes stop_codon:yes gene_type:complete